MPRRGNFAFYSSSYYNKRLLNGSKFALSHFDIVVLSLVVHLYQKSVYLHLMDTAELLKLLQYEAKQIVTGNREALVHLEEISAGAANNLPVTMARYNFAVFKELQTAEGICPGVPVDGSRLADFRMRIDRYMDDYGPDEQGFKAYVRTVATYLAFIAQRPLHPPGMVITGDRTIELRDGHWRCPAKKEQVRVPGSLCKYCVCLGD